MGVRGCKSGGNGAVEYHAQPGACTIGDGQGCAVYRAGQPAMEEVTIDDEVKLG